MTADSGLASRVALVLGGLGAVAVLSAWVGSSSTPLVGRQAAWGALGVAGTFGVTAASFLWVATARQAVARRTAELRGLILAGVAQLRTERAEKRSGDAAVPGARPDDRPEFVATTTMVHYHRPGCRLADGKAVEPAGRADHERAGRTPCGVCEP
ncbi:MAG: hypothetical protein QOE80_1726 [Actinomycetota bacterium]|jgi:hypothetical protein|nr:hypothetical protein [Actinomycetota bacterium]